MANAFDTYMRAKQGALQQGAQMVAMDQTMQQIQRNRALRNALSSAYVPSQAPIPTEMGMGPTRPGTPGGMDWEKAMTLAAQGNVMPEMLQTRAGLMKGGQLPSTVQEWQYYNQLPPKDQKRFLQMKRAAQFQVIGGVPTEVGGGAPPRPLSTIEAETEAKSKLAAAQKFGAMKGEMKAQEPKARMTAEISKGKAALVDKAIDKAIKQTSGWTAGMGSKTAWIAGSPAKDLAETLNTVRANVGFDRLQEMRESSKTGGALGQVSEMENKLLQSVLGSLDQAQSPEQLIENLNIIKKTVKESWQRVARAYEQDYGRPMPTEGTPLAAQGNAPKVKIGQIITGPDGNKYIVQTLKPDGTPDEVMPAR